MATLHVPFVTACPIDLSEAILLAYRDPSIGAAEFEAVVRRIYGDEPDEISSDTIAERHREIGEYRAARGAA